MDKKITKDGSVTFYNEGVGETYHSITGAKEEAIKKFVEPSLSFFENRRELCVLDFCFGLGYNSAALMDAFSGKLDIVAVENDVDIIKKIKDIDYPFLCRDIMQKVSDAFSYKDDRISIKLYIHDALSFDYGTDKFDIVFFDPFSPKKAPELWTDEVFRKTFLSMRKGSILVTYSCAGRVRRTMKDVGFIVRDGPSVGRRSPSTIAVKR